MTACKPEPLHIGQARQIAQQHVGSDKYVVACWPLHDRELCSALAAVTFLPAALGFAVPDPDAEFHFAVFDRQPRRVGGTEYIAVCRATGAVRELGMIGD